MITFTQHVNMGKPITNKKSGDQVKSHVPKIYTNINRVPIRAVVNTVVILPVIRTRRSIYFMIVRMEVVLRIKNPGEIYGALFSIMARRTIDN